MPERRMLAFRISDDDDDRLKELCAEQDRSRSDVARRVFHAGLDALADASSAPAHAETPEPGSHPFKPQARNALKCETCGHKKGDHS